MQQCTNLPASQSRRSAAGTYHQQARSNMPIVCIDMHYTSQLYTYACMPNNQQPTMRRQSMLLNSRCYLLLRAGVALYLTLVTLPTMLARHVAQCDDLSH